MCSFLLHFFCEITRGQLDLLKYYGKGSVHCSEYLILASFLNLNSKFCENKGKFILTQTPIVGKQSDDL